MERANKMPAKRAKLRAGILILLAIGLICVCTSDMHAGPRDCLSGINKTTSIRDSFVATELSKLHYLEGGTGRPVVMIHGNPGDVRDFEYGAMDLMVRSYHVYAFDLPGHGLSAMPASNKGTLEEQVIALHQALFMLEVRQPILVGHSWGGGVALAYALRYPEDVSALVLVAPIAYPDKNHDTPACHLMGVPVFGDLLFTMFKPILGKKLLKKSLEQAFSPDAVPDPYLKSCASTWLDRKRFKTFMKEDMVANSCLARMSPGYPTISVPVIIVTGDSDLALSAPRNALALHTAIANSELIMVPKAGHEIPIVHPEAILEAIGASCDSLAEGGL